MPSSTSSSDPGGAGATAAGVGQPGEDRAGRPERRGPELSGTSRDTPRGLWGRSWALALGLLLLLEGLGEFSLRSQGLVPSIADTRGYWIATRQQLDDAGDDDIALIGASRIQLDVDLELLGEAAGSVPIELAINGSLCYPMLAHLADETDFAGLLLCSLTPAHFGVPANRHHGVQAQYISAYQQCSASAAWEARLTAELDGALVSRRSGVTRFVLSPLRGGLPRRHPYHVMDRLRHVRADYSFADVDERLEHRLQGLRAGPPGMDADDFSRFVTAISAAARAIADRGGLLVLLRMPSSGPVLELEGQLYPRATYWDVLAAQVPAVTIHFADHPELSGFSCPDGSHLDQRDARPFTRGLIDVLREELARRGGRWGAWGR